MSTEIDRKIVSMEFDNARFEKNVHTSMSTLERLKKSLNLKGASDGLAAVEKASKNFDMSAVGNAAEAVRVKFSALQIAGITALQRITNEAITTGKQLVKSLSIDQITAGYNKYEQKTASVQTLMNSTGKSIDEINAYLQKLMWFSDETSYGFTDMTASLAQMTAAGGDIEKLIPMIMGIANSTAFAGKGASEFSRAIYNLNQSYSGGFLNYIDWKSVDMAGASSKELKQTFIDTAIALGTLSKEGRTASGELVTIANFGQTLSEKWATTEVMEQTFTKFASATTKAYEMIRDETNDIELASDAYAALEGHFDEVALKAAKSAQEAKSFSEAINATKDAVSSGWLKTFELIFGNYQEAKVLWTDLANWLWDTFASGAEERNSKLEDAMGDSWTVISKKVSEAGLEVNDFKKSLAEVAGLYTPASRNVEETINACNDAVKTLGGYFPKLGDANDYVATLQNGLYDLGLIGKDAISGIFDKKTEEAVKNFQKTMRFAYADGRAGRTVFKKLGEELKQSGSVVKELEYDFSNFDEDLKSGKISAKDFSEAFRRYIDKLPAKIEELSDEQIKNTGYTREQLLVIRDLGREAELTDSDLNNLIKTINQPSGRELLVETFMNVLEKISGLITIVKETWAEVFPEVTAEKLKNIISDLNSFITNLDMTAETADKVRRIFKGYFSSFNVFTKLVGTVFGTTAKLIVTVLKGLDVDILEVLALIGDWITEASKWLSNNNLMVQGMTVLAEVIVNVLSVVQKFVRGFFEIEQVQNILNSLGESITKLWAEFQVAFGGILKIVSNFFASFEDVDKLTMDVVFQKVKAMWSEMKQFFTDSFGEANSFMEKIKNLWNTFIKYFNQVSPTLGKAVSFVADILKKIIQSVVDSFGFAEIATIAIGYALVKIAESVYSLIEVFGKILNIGKTLVGAIDTITKSVSGYFNTLTESIKKKNILTTAVAIAILAGSLALLAFIPVEKLKQGGIAMTALAVGLGALMWVIGKIGSGPDIKQACLSLLAFATSLIIMTSALRILDNAKSSVDDMALKLLVLVGAIALMATILGILSNKAPEFTMNVIGIVAMAASLLIVAKAMQMIGEIPPGKIGKAGVVLSALMIVMGIMMVLGRFCKAGAKYSVYIGIAILAIAVAMKVLGSINTSSAKRSVLGLVEVVAVLLPLMITVGLLRETANKAGLAMLAVATSLMLIATACIIIGGLKVEKLVKSIGTIIVLFGLLSVMTAVAPKSDFNGKGIMQISLMLMGLASAMILIAAAMVIMSVVKPEKLIAPIIAVLTTFYGFALVIKSMEKLSSVGKDVVGPIKQISVAIGILIIALAALSMVAKSNAAGLVTATACLGTILGIFSIALYASQYAQKATGPLLAMVAVIGIIGGVIYLLGTLPTDSALAAAESLSLVIMALAVSMAIIGFTAPLSKQALGGVAAMTAVVLALAVIMGTLTLFDCAPSIETAASLSLMLISLAGALAIVTAVGAFAPAATTGMLALLTFVAEVAALISALVWVSSKWETAESDLDRVIGILRKIGEAFGSILDGFLLGATANLPTISERLTTFFNAMGGILEQIKGFGDNEASVDTFLEFAKSLKSLNEINDLDVPDATVISAKFTPFAEAIKTFSNALSGENAINTDAVDSASNAAQALTSLSAAIPKSGGKWQTFFGSQNMETFGVQLKAFGESLVAFSSAVSGEAIDSEAIGDACDAAEDLITAFSDLEKSGGRWQYFFGEQDIAGFGTQLEKFGGSLVGFSTAITSNGGVNKTAVQDACDVAEDLVGAFSKLPLSGGMIDDLLGTTDIAGFGTKLKTFGRDLQIFSFRITSCGGVDKVAVENAADATAKLLDTFSGLPTSGGILDGLFGTTMSFEDFGTQLGKLGDALVEFSNKDVNTVRMTSMTNIIGNLITKFKDMEGIDAGNVSKFDEAIRKLGTSFVDAFGEAMATSKGSLDAAIKEMILSLATGLSESFGPVSVAFSAEFDKCYRACMEKKLIFRELGKTIIHYLDSGLRFKPDIVKQAIGGLVNNAISDSTVYHYDMFMTNGKTIANKLADGILYDPNIAKNALQTLINNAANGIDTKSFYNAGVYAVNGFENGLKDKEAVRKVGTAAYELGKKAYTKAMEAINAHSPSKLMMEVGKYFDQGFAIGIEDNAGYAENASGSMAESVIRTTQDALKRVGEMVLNDVDTTPTIRPVLDLSNVESGTRRLNTIFSQTQALRASASFGQNGMTETDTTTAGGNVYQFTQNNYSPKALSRIEIYRQTKNQFSAMERMVKT